MMKGWIDSVRVTHGMAIIRDPDEILEPIQWGPWQRTFLFMPRKDIHGNYIFGPAWYRRVNSVIREIATGGYIMIDMDEVEEFSRNKKDIFVRGLKGDL